MAKASACSFTSSNLMRSTRESFILRSSATLVVPLVETTVLSRRSSHLWMPDAVLTSMRMPAM